MREPGITNSATVDRPRRIVFLPGVGADPDFWRPVAQRLPGDWEMVRLSWPGLGDQPHDPSVAGFDDLVARVGAVLDESCDLVAQSMGGLVAVTAIARFPGRVRRLVLAATSGGIDVRALGATDWRPEYRLAYPRSASWILDVQPDLSELLAAIDIPTLLLWGDADPLSPVAVGEHLRALMPNATLTVVPGGTHSLALEQPDAVAAAIRAHLS